jgi:hypothetical protein
MGTIILQSDNLTPEQIRAQMAVCAMCNALQWEEPPTILSHTPEDWFLSLEDARSITQIIGSPPDMSPDWEDRLEDDAKLKLTIDLIAERAEKRKK